MCRILSESSPLVFALVEVRSISEHSIFNEFLNLIHQFVCCLLISVIVYACYTRKSTLNMYMVTFSGNAIYRLQTVVTTQCMPDDTVMEIRVSMSFTFLVHEMKLTLKSWKNRAFLM
jgi:hypothetical protein